MLPKHILESQEESLTCFGIRWQPLYPDSTHTRVSTEYLQDTAGWNNQSRFPPTSKLGLDMEMWYMVISSHCLVPFDFIVPSTRVLTSACSYSLFRVLNPMPRSELRSTDYTVFSMSPCSPLRGIYARFSQLFLFPCPHANKSVVF